MNIKRILNLVDKLVFCLFVIIMPLKMSANNQNSPNFKFPQTVKTNAEVALERAIAANNGRATVEALIQLGVAECMVAPDSLPAIIHKVDGVRAQEKSPSTYSMLSLLTAKLYDFYYNSNRWDIDRRTTVSGESDMTLWSGEQFRDKIMQTLAEALAAGQVLQRMPLSDYKGVIDYDSQIQLFYPTLFDFASSQALDLLSGISANVHIMPMRSIVTKVTPSAIMPEADRMGINVADNWVEANRNTLAPRVKALMERCKYLQNHCIYKDKPEDVFDETLRLYESCCEGNPYAIDIILAADAFTQEQKQKKYDILTAFAQQNRNYYAINNVKSAIALLSVSNVMVNFPGQVMKDREFEITVKAQNIESFKLQIYKLRENVTGSYVKLSDTEGMPVVTIPVDAYTGTPGYKELKVKAKVPEYGKYIIVASSPKLLSDRGYDSFVCSDLTIIDNILNEDGMAWVVNADTGKPVPGANVKKYESWNKKGVTETYDVDSEGAVKLPFSKTGYNISPQLGNDVYGYPLNVWLSKDMSRVNRAVMFRTDLAVYHPGDVVNFVAFAYTVCGREQKPMAGGLDIQLRDANGMPVDTLSQILDVFGRLSGSFTLPTEGLTGNYSLNAIYNGERIGSQSFLVSDYKLPTYEATIDSITTLGDGSEGVVIRGSAMTYSGFPVQNAKVSITLEGGPGWFRWEVPMKFATLEGETNSLGDFAIEVSPDILLQAPYRNGVVFVQALVTSATGENRTAAKSFSIGKPYTIHATFGSDVIARADVRLPISIFNMVGEEIDGTVTIKFGDEKEIVTKVTNGACVVDLSHMASGTYSVTITTPELDAEPLVFDQVVYNPADNVCPVADAILWMPIKQMKLKAGAGDFKVPVMTAYEEQPAIMVLSAAGKIVGRKWVTLHKGMNEFTLPIPKEAMLMTVGFMAVNDLRSDVQEVHFEVVEPAKELAIAIESMHDKVTPGAEERITIKVTDGNGAGVQSALVLDMYCKALDAINMQQWPFIPLTSFTPKMQSAIMTPGRNTSVVEGTYPQFKNIYVVPPTFNFYGHEDVFDGLPVYYSSYRRVGRARVESKMSMNAVEEESVVADMSYAAAPAESDVILNDDAGSEIADDKPTVDYRPAEVALGFFAPDLTIGDDGSLSYTFTMPNANTTWVLNALAVSKLFSTAFETADIVSAKPVMIQPNMPRFIRQGDKVDVCVAVMNATDANAQVVTEMEILDPSDMRVISRQSSEGEVAAGSSITEVFAIDDYPQIPALLVRVKSTAGNYTDAVQTLLPVLPATQRVIDAETFYLTPEQQKFSVEMPTSSDDAVTTVSFCENPTWEVVSALPGLRADNDGSALGASAAIFSAAVSGKVLDLNPEIKSHLSEWLSGNADDTSLLSMLNRNEELKQMVLSSTPWVTEARNDAERIARLALLFKDNEIENTIASNVDALAKLQMKDGGWKWTASSLESSLWVTLAVLNNFAELRQLNCFPSAMQEQVNKALEYVDAEVAEVYKKYPGSTFEYYTYVRSLYPEVALKGSARNAFDSTVAKMKKNWGNEGVCAKAAVALVLYRTGDKSMAREILSSIRQFATSTPQLGMWFDSIEHSTYFSLYANGQTAFILDAFNTIEPGCAEVDPLRQWLILNKTVQDWGTSVNTSAIVASILNCGSNWLYKPGKVKLAVGGKKIETSEIDKLTGRFVVEVDKPKGKLTIERKGESPAWGAVLNTFTGVMTDIEAASLPELSITKQILVKNGDEWVDADSMLVGQVAKVRLIVDTKRDMDYLTIVDERAACMEPVIQTPRNVYCDGAFFYLENRDARTNLFIDRLAKGRYIIEYEMYVNNAGTYSSGVATVQSQYAPEMTAHSAGRAILSTRDFSARDFSARDNE